MNLSALRLPTLAMAAVFATSLIGCGGAGTESFDGGRARAEDIGDRAIKVRTISNEYVPGQVLVAFQPGVTAEQRDAAYSAVGGRVVEVVRTKAMEAAGDPGFAIVQVSGSVEDAISKLKSETRVRAAEPNYIYRHFNSNDPYYTNGSLWGMYGSTTTPANQFGSQAGAAWARGRTGSATVYVAVIDEGVMRTHSDLSANIWTNPFDAADGVDNDGNGYVDDLYGWDFAGNNNTTYDGAADDHGTHCAGTIGARGNNSLGVAGVVWTTRIISCKFLGSNGGTTANAIKAFDYVTDLKTRHGLDIVASNNSWGGGGFSSLLQDAITRHGNANILAVIAAGNSGVNIDVSPSYPASYNNANIISVASITSTGARSSFSNYGATSVDIGAPGSSVWSTVPSRNGSGSSYASYSGTSMATPHVAGGVVLYASSSTARGLALKDAVLAAGTPTSSMSGTTLTGDRLNVSGF